CLRDMTQDKKIIIARVLFVILLAVVIFCPPLQKKHAFSATGIFVYDIFLSVCWVISIMFFSPVKLGYVLVPVLIGMLPFVLPQKHVEDDIRNKNVKWSIAIMPIFWIIQSLLGCIFSWSGPFRAVWMINLLGIVVIAYVIYGIIRCIKNTGFR